MGLQFRFTVSPYLQPTLSVCARACVYALVRVSACVCQSEIEKDRAEQRPAVDLLERKLLTI